MIKCTCIWNINEYHEYELVQADPGCASEGHRLMASARVEDRSRGGDD